MNKKIWSKGKLKQGVICLGDILVRAEFPCTEISLSCLSLIMTRSHAAEPWEGTTTLLVKRDLHNISISLFGLSSMQHYTSLSGAIFSSYEDKQEWLALMSPAKTGAKPQRFRAPHWVCTQGLFQEHQARLTLGVDSSSATLSDLSTKRGINSSLTWDLWEQHCRTSDQQAQVKRIKEVMGFWLCTGMDTERILKPHLTLNQSLEGKEEGGREGKELLQDFPQLSQQQQQGLCSIFTSFHPSLDSQVWHHFPPTEQDELSGVIFSPLLWWKTCRSCCVLPSPPSPAPAPTRRAANAKWKLYSFLRITVTNVAANPDSQTKEQGLEFTWNVEWIIISVSWDINTCMWWLCVALCLPWSSFLSGIINNKSFWGLTAPVIT